MHASHPPFPIHTIQQMVNMGVMATITQSIDAETAVKVRFWMDELLYTDTLRECVRRDGRHGAFFGWTDGWIYK